MDWRLVMLALWGGGTVLTYARVLWMRRASYSLHHDRRARRDYLTAFGLFLVALASALSIALVLFGDSGAGARGFATAVSLGAFLAVGLIMATEKPER